MSACRREIQEEIGIAANKLEFAAVDWAPNGNEGDKMLFLFTDSELHGLDASGLQFPDRELVEARYVKLEELSEFTITRLAKRLEGTARAILSGTSPLYLEHGDAPR